MRFSELQEKAPPGMEQWIKDRKPEFKKRYGDRWQEVLYATAWKQHNESVELDEVDRRGFLKGIGSAALVGAFGSAKAQGFDKDVVINGITKIAGTAWDMRRLGWSRSQAMTVFENKMGYSGELLRVTGMICDLAWGVPKDHYTRNEFISSIKEQAIKNFPSEKSTPSKETEPVLRSAGPSASYAGKIISRIKPNILFTSPVSDVDGKAIVEIRAAADGTITDRKLTSSSGNKEWDNAVLRAIDKAAVLPRDVDGKVPPRIEITFNPKGANESLEQPVAEDIIPDHKKAIKGMHKLSGDQYYDMYKFSKDVAGHDGKKQHNKKDDDDVTDKPFAYAYTDAEEKMIKGADPKAKKITSSKSEEPDNK